jgi:tetratricopeptide (TPR) repeat protein
MKGYSTRDVAEVVDLPASTILSWVRAGLLLPSRGLGNAFVFSFQDVVLLRAARELLDAEVPMRRVKHALQTLREQLPAGRPLSAVHFTAVGERIVARDADTLWEPASGQIILDVSGAGTGESVTRIDGREAATGRAGEPEDPSELTADDWYDRALELEVAAPERAKEAYRRAIEADPDHGEAHLNLGRLLHEEGEVALAEAHYRSALATDPASARAFYNLGVALEDQGRRAGAIQAYESALSLDPGLAVAHFNLSRLFEAQGRPADALSHLASYKRILDRGGPGA